MDTDPKVYPGIKYWKCANCGATFLTREDAQAHKCGAVSIVEVDNTATSSTTLDKTKSSP